MAVFTGVPLLPQVIRHSIALALALVAAMTATPALADVKQGIDLWNAGDYRKAADEWRPSAIAGDAQAQFNLAQAYKLGRGVPGDMAMAESWYRKAALQGLAQAEVNYGLALFDRGERAAALPWLEKAVARGEPRAQLVLGTMLFNGDGVVRDYPRAYAMIVRSSAADVANASKVLAQMDRYIPAEDRQKGLILARQYEAEAQRVALPAAETMSPVGIAAVGSAATPASRHGTTSEPEPFAARSRAVASRPPMISPRGAAQASGAWRIQLGAFGDPSNARKLWSSVGSRFAGRSPSYVKAGALTRLLVGPFATRAEAARACGPIKPCVPSDF